MPTSVPVFVRRDSVVASARPKSITRTRTGAALLARDHDVRGLDVAVDDAARVAVVERLGDLDADVDDLAEAQRLVADQPEQVRAADERHDEEERALVAAEVVDRDDRGVVHLRDDLRLALEALLELRRVRSSRGDELDRDLAVEHRVPRAVDDAHAAPSELPQDLVTIDQRGLDQLRFSKVVRSVVELEPAPAARV